MPFLKNNKINLLLLFVILNVNSLHAQTSKSHLITRQNTEAGVTLSTNGNMATASIEAIQYWHVNKPQSRFKIGTGIRLTSSFGNNKVQYITAPAELTSNKRGPLVFFSPQIPQNIDTLQLNSTQINALNLMIALHYDFNQKWGAEFNIDLIGFSFGSTKSSTLTYGEQSNATRITDANPYPFNALLISDNDRGSLNSEIMISYLYSPRIKLKAGAGFLFNEYQIDNPVLYTNSSGTVIGTDRYRSKSLTFEIGFRYIIQSRKK